MSLEDLFGPVVALGALIATVIFGIRYDHREKSKRTRALESIKRRQAEKAQRSGTLADKHEQIAKEAAASVADPEPTQADVDQVNRTVSKLWRKLKMRGRL